MNLRGDCLACKKLAECNYTSVDKVLASYTCSLFEAAEEPVSQARWSMMKQYGERPAVQAMMVKNEGV